MPELSNKQFVHHLGLRCPACGVNDTATATNLVETDSGSAWQDVHCESCKATWQDVYKLVGYDNLKTEEMR